MNCSDWCCRYLQKKYKEKDDIKQEDDNSDLDSVASDEFEEMLGKMGGLPKDDEDLDYMNDIGEKLKRGKNKNEVEDEDEGMIQLTFVLENCFNFLIVVSGEDEEEEISEDDETIGDQTLNDNDDEGGEITLEQEDEGNHLVAVYDVCCKHYFRRSYRWFG